MGRERTSPGLAELEQALDASALTRPHLLVFLLCFALNVCEGYSLQVMALAVPAIAAEWRIGAYEFGMTLAAMVAGKGIMGIVSGPLGDRFGRRPLLIVAGLLVAIGGLGAGMSTDLTSLSLWRLVSGFGLGVAIPNSMALVADFAPRRYRVMGITLLSGAMALGTIVAGLLGPMLVSAGGWHLLFMAGGLASLILIPFMYFWLDESPKFQVRKHGNSPALSALLARMNINFSSADLGIANRQDAASVEPTTSLFRRYLPVSIMYWTLSGVTGMLSSLLFNWAPTIFISAGAEQVEAFRSVAFVNGGGFVAGLILSLILDRTKRFVMFVPAAAFIFSGAIFLGSGALIEIAGFTLVALLLGFALGPSFMMLGLASRIFPTSMLASAIGVTTAAISLGGVTGPLIGSWMIHRGFTIDTSLALLAAPALFCMVGAIALHIVVDRLPR